MHSQKMSSRSLSIFLPVYNEERNIDSAISEVLKAIQSITDNYEILIINDGSTDGSKEKILRWEKNYSNVKLINHQTNLGYGTALRSGFKNAKKDLILYTDADLPVSLDEVKKILPAMEECDLVIGYRLNRGDSLHRFIYSRIYNFLLRVLLNVRVRDVNFSFKCIRKKALQRCSLNAKSVFIDGELLAEAVRNNFKIKEFPIFYRARKHGRSNFDNPKAALSAAKELLYYWIRRCLRKNEKLK